MNKIKADLLDLVETHEPTELSMRSETPSRRQQIMSRLVTVALSRRGELTKDELLLYSRGLEPFSDEAIKRVCGHLCTTQREAYESKIPELPDLIEMVRIEARKDNPWIPCGRCDGGHIIVERAGSRFAERCECWIAWKERKTALDNDAIADEIRKG